MTDPTHAQHGRHQAAEPDSAASDRQRRLYGAILGTIPDLVYVFDLEHRLVYANNVLLTMWGKTSDEAIGRTCLELGSEPWHAAGTTRDVAAEFLRQRRHLGPAAVIAQVGAVRHPHGDGGARGLPQQGDIFVVGGDEDVDREAAARLRAAPAPRRPHLEEVEEQRAEAVYLGQVDERRENRCRWVERVEPR